MRKLVFASLFLALPLFGYTVTPASGPASGGTEVRIDGVGSFWEYFVYFGSVPAVSTTRVDDDTIVAVTPPHLPGNVPVMLFEYDLFIDTQQTFTFTGDAPSAAFERLLLPIFVPPVPGAFGSEFRTELSGVNLGDYWMPLHGLVQECRCVPLYNFGDTLRLYRGDPLEAIGVAYEGTPGRFIYIAADQAKDFSANLRVYDTSRSAENFGTEIPIVRASEFRTTPFALLGVPRDARFRSTLRLYADRPTTVTVRFGDTASLVTLHGGATLHDPAYAQLGDVPGGRVVIEPDPNGPAVWGFISVTNNETQHITTITPR